MSLPLPRSLSPTKVSTFRNCALAFRFSAVEELEEPGTVATTRGRLVHRALERLFWSTPPGRRDRARAEVCLDHAWDDLAEEVATLELTGPAHQRLRAETELLVDGYYALEDPDLVRPVGVELTLETAFHGAVLRGIIDRLDVTANGDLVVTDYKTGRAPRSAFERSSLTGVTFYALLCEAVLGRRPRVVRLLYLGEPVVITAEPTPEVLDGLRRQLDAVWSAVERGCATEDFRPRQSGLCRSCAWQPYCPAFGGDPDGARVAFPRRRHPAAHRPLAVSLA